MVIGVIVIINIILKEIIIRLVKWIGYGSQTKVMKITTRYVFIAQFINTGILITLVNMKINVANNKSPNQDIVS